MSRTKDNLRQRLDSLILAERQQYRRAQLAIDAGYATFGHLLAYFFSTPKMISQMIGILAYRRIPREKLAEFSRLECGVRDAIMASRLKLTRGAVEWLDSIKNAPPSMIA